MNIYTEYGNIMHMSTGRGHDKKFSTEPGVSKFGLWRTLNYQGASATARRKCLCGMDISGKRFMSLDF